MGYTLFIYVSSSNIWKSSSLLDWLFTPSHDSTYSLLFPFESDCGIGIVTCPVSQLVNKKLLLGMIVRGSSLNEYWVLWPMAVFIRFIPASSIRDIVMSILGNIALPSWISKLFWYNKIWGPWLSLFVCLWDLYRKKHYLINKYLIN